jgi:Flp pilus assembly pilin Flp
MEKPPTAVARLAAGLAQRRRPWRTSQADATSSGRDAARRRGDEGQGLAEYALILAFIAIICIAALVFFGEELFEVLSGQIGSNIGTVVENMP